MRRILILIMLPCALLKMGNISYGQNPSDSLGERHKAFAIKTGVLNPIFGNLSIGGEKYVKNNYSYSFFIGVIPEYRPIFENIYGFFIKAGIKYYFAGEQPQELKGLSSNPEVMLLLRKIELSSLRINEKSVGIFYNLNLQYIIWKKITCELHGGVGLNIYWGDNCYYNDVTPYGWICKDHGKDRGTYYSSHLSIYSNFSFTTGIRIGYKFYN